MKIFNALSLLTVFLLAGSAATAQICEDGMAGQYPCQNVDQLSEISITDLGGGENTNDIWGWTSPETGREYAIVGKSSGTAFVDISDPYSPILIALVPTFSVNSLWRDIKVQGNYAYIVAEAGAHGMQIFDLTRLDDIYCPPEIFSADAVYTMFGNSHNIVIEDGMPYAYSVGTNTFAGGLHIIDISDPLNPQFAGSFEEDGYTHDAQVVQYQGPDAEHQGKEIVFACNADNIAIIDATDKQDVELLSSVTYEQAGYVHQGWLTEDHSYFISNDETDESTFDLNTRTFIWDVQDLENPELIGIYTADSPSIDHNLYIRDGVCYQSNYRSGFRVLDLADVENGNLSEAGYLDIIPEDDNRTYTGTWSNYPYFESGVIPITNMYGGMHVLEPRLIKATRKVVSGCDNEEATFSVESALDLNGSVNVDVQGLPEGITSSINGGESMPTPGSLDVGLSWSDLSAGSYPFEVTVSNSDTSLTLQSELIIESGAPDAPELLGPTNTVMLDYSFATMEWEGGSATEFEVQVAVNESFSILALEQDVSREHFTAQLSEGETYFWRVKAINDCGESEYSETRSFTTTCGEGNVGIEDPEDRRFAVWPNPSNGLVNVTDLEGLADDFRVYDLSGRIAMSGSINEAKTATLDLSELAKGVYLLQIGNSRAEKIAIR